MCGFEKVAYPAQNHNTNFSNYFCMIHSAAVHLYVQIIYIVEKIWVGTQLQIVAHSSVSLLWVEWWQL